MNDGSQSDWGFVANTAVLSALTRSSQPVGVGTWHPLLRNVSPPPHTFQGTCLLRRPRGAAGCRAQCSNPFLSLSLYGKQ